MRGLQRLPPGAPPTGGGSRIAGLLRRVPRAGRRLRGRLPPPPARGVSCSLRPWLEGESPPASWQSLPCPTHPRSGPPGLGLVPGGQARALGRGPPRPFPGSEGWQPPPRPRIRGPRRLAIGPVGHVFGRRPSGRPSGRSPRVPPQARGREAALHARALSGTGRVGAWGRGSFLSAGPFPGHTARNPPLGSATAHFPPEWARLLSPSRRPQPCRAPCRVHSSPSEPLEAVAGTPAHSVRGRPGQASGKWLGRWGSVAGNTLLIQATRV